MFELNRRDLLAGTTSLATLMALGGCESINIAIANRPVRRDLASMASNDIVLQTYRTGVQLMKALPMSDPRNWTRQAQLHRDHCPHGNWFFLPWHRAYLLSFERIIQTLTGVPSFGLPYWNWSCNRSIPAPFWEAGSTLLHPRTATAASQANVNLVGQANIDAILAETDFELFASGAATALRGGGGFYGRLEAQPHNHIHPFTGGDMGGYMSPRDPVFWTHHNILDYLWYVWNVRGNPNTNNPTYTGFDIANHLVNGAGNPVTYRVGALVLGPLLSYRFAPPVQCGQLYDFRESAALRRFLEQGAAIRFQPLREFAASRGLRLAPAQRQSAARMAIPAEALRAAFEPNAPQRLLLRLSDVTPPAEGDFFVQVYVNLGDGETPSPDSPSYAGAFAFFTDEGSHHMTHNYVVDLSGAIDRLRNAGRLQRDAAVDVTLVAVPNVPDRPAMRGAVTIGTIAPITIARRAVPAPLR